MVKAAVARPPGSPPAPLASVIAALEGVLGARYQDCWSLALPVAAELMGQLKRPGAPLASGLIERIGEICSGGDEAAAAGNTASDGMVLAAQEALGAALRSVGPEAVLNVLPLAIQEGLDSGAEARTWLLPLLRTHVRNARLAYWGEAMLPLARDMASRAAKASTRTDDRSRREARICASLEAQIWATLPSFCNWALDVDTAFRWDGVQSGTLSPNVSSTVSATTSLRPLRCAWLLANSYLPARPQTTPQAGHMQRTWPVPSTSAWIFASLFAMH